MTVLLTILRAIGWRGVIIAVVVIIAAGWHLSAVSKAHEAGAQSVRLQWQEANRRAELKAIAKQKKQQDEINRVEITLLNEREQASTRLKSLQDALDAERAENEKSGVDLSVCRLSDRMRNQLLYRAP